MHVPPLSSVYKLTNPWHDVHTCCQLFLHRQNSEFFAHNFSLQQTKDISLFNPQQSVLLYVVIFSFYMFICCPVYNSYDVLLIGFAFRIRIPFKNSQAEI
jgi:hypothetical protein